MESTEKVYSSAMNIEMDKEYFYQKYSYLRKENSPVYGVSDPSEVNFSVLSFDELCYLLNTEGTHLIFFGGPWCPNTAGVADYINFYARKYGVDTVYNFDFRMDGESRDANIREDLTAQPSYDGPDKAETSVIGAEYNYIYGELVNRFLTNLNDWVAFKEGTGHEITYLDLYEETQTAPKVQVPFLFLYNKDNKIDHSGVVRGDDYVNESGTYPIVYAIEKMYFRDAENGNLYSDREIHDETTIVNDYGEQLEKAIFSHIGEDGVTITPYTHSDYIRDTYRMNGRGHSFKTQNAFTEDEQINIQMVTLNELNWILDRKGTFLILFGGAWCANTQAAVSVVNDYAVANNLKVYMFDTRLDGKYPIDFWKYPRAKELQIRSDKHPLKKLYIDLIENHLSNISTIYDPHGFDAPIISYTDEEGNVHSVGRLQAPHFLAVNKDNIDGRGNSKPVLAYCERMYELINCNDTFIYSEPNYKDYKAGAYKVIYEYCKREGLEPHEITVDKTAPIVEGEPIRHVETEEHHKEHDWYKERAVKNEDCGCC
jgi:hypothetical protein